MNPLDHQLDRLLAAAATGRQTGTLSPAYGLETHVLAAWRSSQGAALGWDTSVLVRGLALAAVLMTISAWPALSQRTNSDSEALQFADSTVQTDVSP